MMALAGFARCAVRSQPVHYFGRGNGRSDRDTQPRANRLHDVRAHARRGQRLDVRAQGGEQQGEADAEHVPCDELFGVTPSDTRCEEDRGRVPPSVVPPCRAARCRRHPSGRGGAKRHPDREVQSPRDRSEQKIAAEPGGDSNGRNYTRKAHRDHRL